MLCGGQSKLHPLLHRPNPVTGEGRIVGSIVMLVGIGVTSTLISTLAAGLTRSGIKQASTENDPKLILKTRLATYMELLRLLSE